jgi:gamma-glutamylcyclotransferase (GGCT)/AIG2-like uncharacterized protein YtfP
MMEKFDEHAAAEILRAPATQRLFVYGTLLSTAAGDYGKGARLRLISEAFPRRFPATTAGRLYELGQYPGLVASSAAPDIVHGQLLLLSDPAATLPWLDEYEMISSAPHAGNEYVRQLRDVSIIGGQTVSAWSYLYLKSVVGLPRIPSGRWQSVRPDQMAV